jgi:hypothetical protein
VPGCPAADPEISPPVQGAASDGHPRDAPVYGLDGSTPADWRLWRAKRGLCRGFDSPSLLIKSCFLVGERRIGSPTCLLGRHCGAYGDGVRSYELRPRMLAGR